MSAPDVSVVVVHHRGRGHLLEALEGLEAACASLSAETILVDNTGGRPVEEVLRRHPTLRRVVAGGNVGFARGCGLGAQAARSPLLVFVNDDATVASDAVGLLVQTLASSPADVVAAAGRLVDRSGEKNDFSDGFLTFEPGKEYRSVDGMKVNLVEAA